MKYIFPVLMLFLFVSCSRKQQEERENIQKHQTTKTSVVRVSEDQEVNEPAKEENDTVILKGLAKVLYYDFINGNFGPFALKNDSGYYSLDLEGYFESLDKMGIFSKVFYEKEKKRVWQCREDLEELKFRGDAELGWEPESCFFFNYMYWLKSQESPAGFEIQGLQINDGIANLQIVCFNEYDGQKNYWKEIDVVFQKEGKEWKVINVSDK
ncbi:MAG: hypothetical protein JXQ96_13510 [Cyclobacteriaceae bacterium]